MAQAARAPATAKAAPKKEQNATAALQPKRTPAPAVQRVAPRNTPCACGGHCPKCQRTSAPSAVPSPLPVEDSAAEQEAVEIARILTTGLGGVNPPPPDENNSPSTSIVARQLPPARPRIQPTASPDAKLGSGAGLPDFVRRQLEPALGFDLSAVRVHTDPRADQLATHYRARALTFGSHLVFARGEYAPHSDDGLRVLAHEVVHAVQQNPVRDPWSSGSLANQARPRGPPQHGPSHLFVHNHFSQPRVQCWRRPTWDDVSNAAVNVGSAALDTAVDLGTSAVGVAVDVGEGALEIGAEVVERTADFFIGLIDDYAPGLLEFLRGGFMSRLTDLFCRGLDAVIGGLISSLESIDFVSALEEAFSSAQGSVEGVIGAIQSGASSALGALMQPVVEALDEYGPGIIDAITGASDSVNGFFDSIWDSIGAPALDFLEEAGGAIWQEISDMIDWLWDATEDVRDAAADAWDWVMEQFGIAWEGTSGIRDWLSEKATEAWDSMKEALGPLEGPITVLLGVLVILSPLGPIVIATQVIPPLWEKLVWLWNNWNTDDILVWAQDTLREDILPSVIGLVSGVASAIAGAASWIAGITVQVAEAFGGVLSAFGTNSCLATVTRVLNAVSSQFERLAAWAEGGFTGLADAVSNVFNSIVAILQPILDFLVRLLLVATNPPMLPIAITGAIWLLIPDDLKPPVINFVLDLIIAFLRGFPAFLTGLGPLASILKAGFLGFLQGLRDQEDQRKIDASNKVANLMAGAGLRFIAGFAVGILEGLLDGILDPFRLIWMLVQFLARICRAIGDYLAPLVFETAPPLGAAVAGFNSTVRASIPDHPPAHAPPPVAGEGTATLTRAEPSSTSTPPAPSGGEITRATPGAIAGPTSSAPPVGGASPSPSVAAASPEDAAMAEIIGAGPTRSDADIVASLSPGVAGELSGAAGELDAVSAEGGTSAESELRSEGSSVSGLSGLLGNIWNTIIEGAHSMGARAANALIEFILLPDYELGNKIGYVAGLVLLEVIIAYFSGGVSVELKAAEPFIKAAIRFLDLGGEILGLLGRAIRPIKGPLLRGLSAAGEHLGRFRFLQPIIQRVRRAANTLFHFGDEAVEAAGRAGGHADDVARNADNIADAASTTRRADDVADAAGAGRRTDDAADAGRRTDDAADAARKAAELPVAMAAAEAICAANDRIEPSPPTAAVHAQLNASLRPRFRWIEGFFSVLKAPGVYEIHMRASDHVIDRRYTAGVSVDEHGNVTPHPDTPAPIVEKRRGGSGATPIESASPQPHPRPDAPEPDAPRSRLDDELDDALDDAPDSPYTTVEDTPLRDPGRGTADDLADEGLSPLDRPRGSPPMESGIRGDIGEVTHAGEVVNATPRRATDHYSNATLAEMREELLRGDISLREFAERFPDEGAAQVFFPSALGNGGGRYIDHMYVDGAEVVLRESKNVANFRLVDDYALQIQKDLDLLNAFPDARVEWRISGDVDPEALDVLRQLADENPRFGFRLDTPGPYTYADGRYVVPRPGPGPEVIRRESYAAQPNQLPEAVREAAQRPGMPLPEGFRKRASSFFEADLSQVRVHDDAMSARAATQCRAHALAYGDHILLGASRRNFDSPVTQATLVHEIAHTLQPPTHDSSRPTFEPDNSPAELAARATAEAFSANTTAAKPTATANRSATLQKQDHGDDSVEVDLVPASPAESDEARSRGITLPGVSSGTWSAIGGSPYTTIMPGYSQEGDSCGAASLVTALLIWDREHWNPAAPNERLVLACDLILGEFSRHGATAVSHWAANPMPGMRRLAREHSVDIANIADAIGDNLKGELRRIRNAARVPGARVSEGDYGKLGLALYFLWRRGSGAGLSSSEIERMQQSLGLQGARGSSAGIQSFGEIFGNSLVTGLQPDAMVQVAWLVSSGPHAFLVGRLADGTWFWSDQGTRPAREFQAGTLSALRSAVEVAASSGYWIYTGNSASFPILVGWTGILPLGSANGPIAAAHNLIPPGATLGEVDAGYTVSGDTLTNDGYVGRGYDRTTVAALLPVGSGGGAIIEMPTGVFTLYRTSAVSASNLSQSALDADDSRGNQLGSPRKFLHAWLQLGTSGGLRGSWFQVY